MANLSFARKVEPTNTDLMAHIETCEQWRDDDLPTVPSTIGQELRINPFLRWHSPAIIEQLKQEGRHMGDLPADVFGAVRGWKDEG